MGCLGGEAAGNCAPLREERVQLGHEAGLLLTIDVHRRGCARQQRRHQFVEAFADAGSGAVCLAIGAEQIGEGGGTLGQALLQEVEGGMVAQQDPEALAGLLGGTELPTHQGFRQHRGLLDRGLCRLALVGRLPAELLHHLPGDQHARGEGFRGDLRYRDDVVLLADHVLPGERLPEETRGKVGDDLAGVFPRAALHRGAGADAVQLPDGVGVLLQAADEAGHVRAAPAGVGMHLVQDQEAQHPGVLRGEEGAVLEAGEQQLQLRVVGHQDVRGRLPDLLARQQLAVIRFRPARRPLHVLLRSGVLARGEGVGRVAGVERDLQPRTVKPLREVLVLAVGEGVHRVDDDRLDPRHALLPQA